jgi:hypothetical protein
MQHQYNLGKGVNDTIDNMAAANPNDKLLQNMSANKDMSHGSAKKRKHDLEQMQKTNPDRFASINGNQLLQAIDSKLDIDTTMSKQHKQFKRDVLGDTNAFQKPGGTKNNGKTSGGMLVNYEN